MQKILFIESDHDWLKRYRSELPELDPRGAVTLEEAESFWRDEGPFACVVVGGIAAGKPTFSFVRMLRGEGFTGPIIAASNMPAVRRKLLEAGCSHAVANTKAGTSALVRQALGI
ncbi:MAG TPA: hypothetical protein VJI96_00610 [Candidatus Andersenbacteria bacterium]|nr:hypothetical protein [Candidatus Andersenbacteria bacterium]